MLRTLVTASLLTVSIALEGGSKRIVFDASGTEHTWALKELNPELPSDWSGYQYLVFELRTSTPQRFELRIHTPSGVRTVWMHPFAGVWIRTVLPLATLARPEQSAVDLAAMSNKPRALSFFTGAHGQGPLDQVQGIGVRMPSPVGAAALELRTLRLAKEDPGDALLESGPLVDQFGQWMPTEWPGKARDLTQLRSEWAEESEALRPGSFGFDKYGGYTATQARATGFFRVEQIDGRWWFVDPDGHLFLSTGADATRWAMETTTLNRRGIFEALPPAELNRLSSRGEDRQMVSFYTWNLLRRFGSNWQQQWVDSTLKRMAAWGFNTIANWSDPALWAAQRAPYVIPLEGWGMESGWFGMPDVYAPEWPKQVDEAARRQCSPRRFDPWLLGYFVANEPSWPGREALAADQILQGRDTATKRELLASLAQGDTPERRNAFLIRCFERELEVINAAIRKYDHNHLNLGIRFGGHPDDDVVRVARVFDVFSLNIYSDVPDRTRLDRIYAATGRPILIGEFHMGTPGRGMSAGLVTVRDQAQRGVAYRYYVENAFAMPALIGAHWFQWADEANTGRNDGENYNIGFIDVTDRPYQELIGAAKQAHRRLFAVHSGSERPVEQRAVSR
ncbi:MAG: hypothetical protein ACJ74Z_18265 [Bryobacteraceae bacterium]